jgi:hypothetical protein
MNDEVELEEEEVAELGRRVEARTGRSSVVAVRVSADLLDRASTYARTNGTTVSDVFREGVEQLIAASVPHKVVNVTGLYVFGSGITVGSLTGTTGVSRVLEARPVDRVVAGSMTAVP